MARGDWSIMTGSLDGTGWEGATVLRNATLGFPTPPPGGGSSVFAFNSVEPVVGGVVVYTQVSGFSPLTGGGQITGAIQRGVSGGAEGFSNFLVLCASGSNISDKAYMLGIEDKSPGRIVLAKGTMLKGIPNEANVTAATKVIRTSSVTISQGEWIHLRMDVIVQDSGDVVIKCYKNDLTAHPLDNPTAWVWEPIEFDDEWSSLFDPGEFVDDVTGVRTGSTPLLSGYAGYGFVCSESARRAYFDHIGIVKQG